MQRWHFKWIMPQQPSIFWYSFRPHFVQKRQPSRWSFSRSFILSDLHQGKYVTIWNIASQDIQILHTVSKNPARYAKMPCHIFESWIVYVQTRSRYIMQGVRKLEQRHSCSNKTFRRRSPTAIMSQNLPLSGTEDLDRDNAYGEVDVQFRVLT